jgi:diacylglycerol kinase family enzyme
VNEKLFFNVAHVGIGAALAGSLTGGMKKRLGPLAYTLAAARTLLAIRFFRAEIFAGDEHFALRTFGVTVGNGRFFGGSGVVAEDAEIDDGLLHMFALTSKNPIRLLAMLPAITRGTHGRAKDIRTLAAPAIEIHTVRPMPIRADGKIVTETPARISLRRAALSVYAPITTS